MHGFIYVRATPIYCLHGCEGAMHVVDSLISDSTIVVVVV